MYITIAEKEFCREARHINHRSCSTIKRYRSVLSVYFRFAGIRETADINGENVRELLAHGSAARNWKPNTFLVYKKTLSSFFRWCRMRGHMTGDPLRDIASPRRPSAIPRSLTVEHGQRLLDTAYNLPCEHRYLRYRNRAIFSLFLFAGLRRGELLGLRYSDIDTEHMTILVRQGKGAKDRAVPMSFTLAQALLEYESERRRLKKTCPEYFASLRRNAGLTSDGLRHLTGTVRQASGIPFTIHMLRHTFATLMLEGGCDIYSLSKMMGHADISSTTIYLSATVEHLRGQIGKHPLN